MNAFWLKGQDVQAVSLLHERHGNRLYRVHCAEHSYVVKQFSGAGQAAEPACYRLLQECSVPTLPVHFRGPNMLVLEDLETSTAWRLATEDDIERAETGAALARWYLVLHAAGRAFLDQSSDVPTFLARESDALSAEGLHRLGVKLGLAGNSGWALAIEHVESLKHAMRGLPETFTYDDFYWGNLALSREKHPHQAIVFDYHLLGIGLAYSDCRNVTVSLGDPALKAFWDTYGAYDPQEALLDAPMSVLVALDEAGRRSRFPSWAEGPLEEVRNGNLERNLRRVIETI